MRENIPLLHKEKSALADWLHSIGVEAVEVEVTGRSDSHCRVNCAPGDPHAKVVPVLEIHIGTVEGYRMLAIDPGRNNWGSDYPRTGEIRHKWRELLTAAASLDRSISGQFHDPDMLVFFRSREQDQLRRPVYDQRDKIHRLILSVSTVPPKEVFCCSALGYNIAYASRVDLERAELRGEHPRIQRAVIATLQNQSLPGRSHIVAELLQMKFLHPEMQGFSWYGPARQD